MPPLVNVRVPLLTAGTTGGPAEYGVLVMVMPVSAASLVAAQLQVFAAVLVKVTLTEWAMPRLSNTVIVVGTVVAGTAGGPTTAAVAPASRFPLRVTCEVARAVVRWPIGITRLVM